MIQMLISGWHDSDRLTYNVDCQRLHHADYGHYYSGGRVDVTAIFSSATGVLASVTRMPTTLVQMSAVGVPNSKRKRY